MVIYYHVSTIAEGVWIDQRLWSREASTAINVCVDVLFTQGVDGTRAVLNRRTIPYLKRIGKGVMAAVSTTVVDQFLLRALAMKVSRTNQDSEDSQSDPG